MKKTLNLHSQDVPASEAVASLDDCFDSDPTPVRPSYGIARVVRVAGGITVSMTDGRSVFLSNETIEQAPWPTVAD